VHKEADTYTTHTKHNRQTSIPSVGLEPKIPAINQLQTYALDYAATGIGIDWFTCGLKCEAYVTPEVTFQYKKHKYILIV